MWIIYEEKHEKLSFMECDSKAMNKVAIERGTCIEATAGCPDLLLETKNLLSHVSMKLI